jgi:hypothetical protein
MFLVTYIRIHENINSAVAQILSQHVNKNGILLLQPRSRYLFIPSSLLVTNRIEAFENSPKNPDYSIITGYAL